MAGGGQSSGTVSKTEPWGAQKPYLKDIYRRAKRLSKTEMPFYPGETVAPLSADTLSGEEMVRQRATAGSPLIGAAESYYGDVLGGRYLNANPWLDTTYARAAQNVGEQFRRITMPELEGRFARAGRTGGGAYEGALRTAGGELADRLAQLGEDIYAGDYVRERARMDTAAAAAPGISEAGYMDAQRLRELGAGEETYAQKLINSLIQRYEYTQQEPWQRLSNYSALAGQPVMTQKSQPMNPTLSMLQAIQSMIEL